MPFIGIKMKKAFFEINPQSTIFTFADHSQLRLNVGYDSVIEHDFKHHFPNAYQTEMAIITIETAIEQVMTLWQKTAILQTDNGEIKKIANYFNNEKSLSTEQIERLFNRVADIIAGSPRQHDPLPDSLQFTASLLILREVLHHLNIDVIELV